MLFENESTNLEDSLKQAETGTSSDAANTDEQNVEDQQNTPQEKEKSADSTEVSPTEPAKETENPVDESQSETVEPIEDSSDEGKEDIDQQEPAPLEEVVSVENTSAEDIDQQEPSPLEEVVSVENTSMEDTDQQEPSPLEEVVSVENTPAEDTDQQEPAPREEVVSAENTSAEDADIPTPHEVEASGEEVSSEVQKVNEAQEVNTAVVDKSSVEEPKKEEPVSAAQTESPPSEPDAGGDPSQAHVEKQAENDKEDAMWSSWGELDSEQKGLLTKVDEILDEEQSARLLDASPEDLIALLEKYVVGDISENIPKVGLLKRSFDAIRAQSAVSEELTEQFRVALANFNKKRVELQKVQEAQKAENAKKKRTLIEQLKAIVDSEDVYKIKEVRDIQNEWKAIGHIPKKDMESLYMDYRTLLDTFYQRREMHFELLEYDRKINLQEKEKLIEEAKSLIPPLEDRENLGTWNQKMNHFREIQEQWRSIGHVPKEDLDRIRDEFRTAIDQFFEARQQFLEVLDGQKEENQRKKEELLAEMKKFEEYTARKPKEWNDATQDFRALQEAWKALGPAPKSSNNDLWQQYRNVADKFFTNKSAYFKQLDDKRSENLTRKQELCEKAEQLKESGEWEKTARDLKKLQNEWKQVGPVPERYSNKIWNRFKTACDKFFEQRRLHYQALHETENINLEKKKKLIEEVVKLAEDEEKDVDLAIERVKELQSEWRDIGKVPYKEKDKIWEEFRREIDKFFNGLSGKREKLREIRLKTSIETITDPDQRTRQIKAKIVRIRKKLQKTEEKIEQYSTNMMFIAKGKSGDPLRKQIQAELDREKEQVDEWKGKIKMLNEMLKNPPQDQDMSDDDDDDDDDNDNDNNNEVRDNASETTDTAKQEEMDQEKKVDSQLSEQVEQPQVQTKGNTEEESTETEEESTEEKTAEESENESEEKPS